VQAIGRQPQRAPDGAPVHYERHRPEQITLYRLVQQHAASFIAHTQARTGAELQIETQTDSVVRLQWVRRPVLAAASSTARHRSGNRWRDESQHAGGVRRSGCQGGTEGAARCFKGRRFACG
jgi:hypothetical protein